MNAEVLVVTWGFLFLFHNEGMATENVCWIKQAKLIDNGC